MIGDQTCGQVAYFSFPYAEASMKITPGDELKMLHKGDITHSPWQSMGHVVSIKVSSPTPLTIPSRFYTNLHQINTKFTDNTLDFPHKG